MSADDLAIRLVDAVSDGDVAFAKRCFSEHPEWISGEHCGDTWLGHASMSDSVEMIQFLISLGCDVNQLRKGRGSRRVLNNAIGNASIEVAQAMLEAGADANAGLPILGAVLCDRGDARERVQLLEQYGANLHVVYPFGPDSVPMTPLGLATVYGLDDVVEYLRSRGARLPSEYSPQEIAAYLGESEPIAENAPSQTGSAEQDVSPTYAAQTLAYFTEHFGPVDPLSLIEIVPSEPQVTVHFIPADASRKCVTLFTTGLAEVEMKAPDDEGAADFRHAELFLQLPADWKYRAYEDPRYAWPIHWLRTIARYPVAADAWLGGPATIFAAGEPLGAGLRFDSWLLMAERKYSAEDGRTVQLYRLTPLYPEERELEEREGIGALLRAFDKHGTPFVIDPNRRNVAT